MQFIIISITALLGLGLVAALASMFTRGGTDEPIVEGRDCSTCSSVASGECRIGCLIEEKKRREGNKTAEGELL